MAKPPPAAGSVASSLARIRKGESNGNSGSVSTSLFLKGISKMPSIPLECVLSYTGHLRKICRISHKPKSPILT